MTVKDNIHNNDLKKEFLKGTIGIEREGLRIDEEGQLALTDHPHVLGNRSYHPYIQTDFSEAQPELITSVSTSSKEVYRKLLAIHAVLQQSLPVDEWFWPYSMPSLLPAEDEIPIVRVEDQSQIDYRENLATKYGKRKQVISGIHFNFGFAPEFIEKYAKTTDCSIKEANNEIHMKLARNFMRYRWLLTYLYGASPYADAEFYNEDETPLKGYVRSVRNSTFGYHNELGVQVSYATVEDYAHDIQQLVKDGVLSQEREFYGSARARGASEVKDLVTKGVQYVELRSLDNNPLDVTGMSLEQIEFIELFCLLMVWIDADASDREELIKGTEMNEKTALENPYTISQYQDEGLALIDKMLEMVNDLDLDDERKSLVKKAQNALKNPSETLSVKVITELEKSDDFISHGLELAKKQKDFFGVEPYLLNGYETMEMSTQLIMFDAIQKGIEVEVIDEHEQFIRLTHGDHEEYVQKGNKTSKDNYVSQLMMANKTVTKRVLYEKGFRVPHGIESHRIEDALSYYEEIKDTAIVVKPKSTNFGIGITVFQTPPSKEVYKEAIMIAFEEDDTILVEEYIAGTEYRFFVLDGKTIAVLLRVPAHVTGDGKQTIRELVVEKNQDPLRGENHRSPLEKIKLGEIEAVTLNEQGYDFDTIVDEGVTAYLRQNSNISNGGDSIDFTDQMDESYKEVAANIATSLGANISGVDLIIPDHEMESTSSKPGYVCLEANFNPAMHMHQYVAQGEGQHVTLHVLDLLFKELNLL